MDVKSWLQNAFAVEKPGALQISDEQRALVERLAREVVRRKLATPAVAFLELSHPLNSVGAHALHFFTPILSVLFDAQGCRRFAEFLEQRGSLEYVCRRIEELLAESQPPAGGSPGSPG